MNPVSKQINHAQMIIIRDELLKFKGQFVPMYDLGVLSGSWHVNSRVSDLRVHHGYNIVNKVVHGPGRTRTSYYRLDDPLP